MIKLKLILFFLSFICICSRTLNAQPVEELVNHQQNNVILQNMPNIELVPYSAWHDRILSHMFPHDTENKNEIHEVRSEVGELQEKTNNTPLPFPPEKETHSSSPSYIPTSTLEKEPKINSPKVNFASAECGAKVVRSNKELKSPSAILVKNTDTYALNPCSEKIWINIELCEEVKIDSITLANLEYFSSQFKDFDLFGSLIEDNDWHYIQSFTAKNEKTPQEFIVTEAQTTYKYLKLQVNTHYGKEYYCPITYIQVYGSSLVEKLIEQVEIDQQHVESIIKLISEMSNNVESTENHSTSHPEVNHTGPKDSKDEENIEGEEVENEITEDQIDLTDNIEDNNVDCVKDENNLNEIITDCDKIVEVNIINNDSEIVQDDANQNGNESINALSQFDFERKMDIKEAVIFPPDELNTNNNHDNKVGETGCNKVLDILPSNIEQIQQKNENVVDEQILTEDPKENKNGNNNIEVENKEVLSDSEFNTKNITESDIGDNVSDENKVPNNNNTNINNTNDNNTTTYNNTTNNNTTNNNKNSNDTNNSNNTESHKNNQKNSTIENGNGKIGNHTENGNSNHTQPIDKSKNQNNTEHHSIEKSYKSTSNHGMVNENFMTKIASRVKQLEINQTILTSYISQFTVNITEIYKNLHAEPFHLLNNSYFNLLSENKRINNLYNQQSQKVENLTKDMEILKEKYDELNENFIKLQTILDHPPNRYFDYHTLEIIVILTVLVLLYFIFRPVNSGTP